MNEHMTNSLVLVVLTHTHLWHFRTFRPCVAGDNQRTSNLFLMLSPETMELERVSGVNTENPMHGYQIKSVHSDSWLIYAHLLAGGLGRWFARFIFVQNWLHKPPPVWTCTIARPFHVFHPHRCQKFHYVISSYIRSHPWATAVLEAEACSQEASSISKFKISVWHSSLARSTGALPEDCWHPNWHPSISSHTWTILTWSTCALPTLTSDDSMCGNLSLILRIG